MSTCSDVKIDGEIYRLLFMDTAGQEAYRSIIPAVVRNAQLAVLVFDVTNPDTFNALPEWIQFVRNIENSAIMIIGNKTDLDERRQVTSSDAQDLANAQGFRYYETSAATGQGVEITFTEICLAAKEKYVDFEKIQLTAGLVDDQLTHETENQNWCC
jgi:Ras-related protein Rab-6A